MKRTIVITMFDFAKDKIETVGKIYMEHRKITFDGFFLRRC
jgi:hypothetical protein